MTEIMRNGNPMGITELLPRKRGEGREEETHHAESEENNDDYGECAFHYPTLTGGKYFFNYRAGVEVAGRS